MNRSDANLFLEPLMPGHPVFDYPKGEDAERFLEKFGVDGWNQMMAERNARIEFEMKNPFYGRVEMPIWHVADFILGLIDWQTLASGKKSDGAPWELEIPQEWLTDRLRDEFESEPVDILYLSGGNRSSKTTYVLDRAYRSLKAHPRSRMWIFHTTSKMSREYHQIPIHDLMTDADRAIGRTATAYVSFKEQTGFSDYSFRLRNGSSCEFHSYEEDLGFAEGGELGAFSRQRAIGYVADENCPLNLLEKLKARNSTRNAVGLHPYTAVDGFTPLVRWFRDSADAVLTARAKYAKGEPELPIVEVKKVSVEGMKPFKIGTVFFWSEWNPYGNFSELRRQHSMDAERVKLVKFYGFAQSENNSIFPQLDDAVHGFDLDELPKEGSNYLYVDPCGEGRNWFMLWLRADPLGRIWVYREWPCEKIAVPNWGIPGPWAVQGQDKQHKFGGLMGDGARGFGFGFLDYKNEIARLEGWDDCSSGLPIEEWCDGNGSLENVVARKIDSRFGNTPHGRADGKNTTLIEECQKINLNFDSASGAQIADGIHIINSKLAYDRRPDGSIAKLPMLMICRDCKNLWFAMRNWTGKGGNKEATKDPIDVLRYGVLDDPIYVGGGAFGSRGGFGFGHVGRGAKSIARYNPQTGERIFIKKNFPKTNQCQ